LLSKFVQKSHLLSGMARSTLPLLLLWTSQENGHESEAWCRWLLAEIPICAGTYALLQKETRILKENETRGKRERERKKI
jgi:hypothetical protein